MDDNNLKKEDLKEIPPALMNALHEINGKAVALFLDYDGTLTPIVRRPDLAVLSEENRSLLIDLAKRNTVAILSGRDLVKIRELVGVPGIFYAGSHGLEIGTLDQLLFENGDAVGLIRQVDSVEKELSEQLKGIEGVVIERKRFSIAIHYRMVASERYDSVYEIVEKILTTHSFLRIRMGKMVYEIEPDVKWDKGTAVEWLLDYLDLNNSSTVPIYIGDDLTDEDAFKVLAGRGVTIAVQDSARSTHAQYTLRSPAEVCAFLIFLKDYL